MSRIRLLAMGFALGLAFLVAAPFAHSAARPKAPTLEERLITIERQSWEAWKNRDGKFFESLLSADHLDIGPQGIADKSHVVAGVNSPACVVASYSLDHFRFTMLDRSTAALIYWAEQSTTCGGSPVPSPTWVTSVYVKRDGRWLNVIFQKTPIPAR